MMVIFKCVVPIFCAHVWIFHELDFKLCLHLAGIEVLSSVSTEKNSHGSLAVNDCFSTGSSKQKKHSGVAGSILLLPVAISFCPIGALQLMHWRATHPRIPEIPPIYVQRCRLLPSWASYPQAYIISTQLAPLNAAQSSLTEFCWIEVKREMNMIALRSRLERNEPSTRNGSIYCRPLRFCFTFITGAVQRVSQEPG